MTRALGSEDGEHDRREADHGQASPTSVEITVPSRQPAGAASGLPRTA
jgi:hypothetical protein